MLTWSPRTIRSPECLSEYEIWVYKDQTSFAFAPSFLPFIIIMSAIAKSNSPIAPVTTESKDWTKASMPELQSGSEDESDILNAKAKERRRHKQVKREEKQCREEVERRVCKEAEARAREQAERQVREQAEKDRAEVQWRVLAQEASKKMSKGGAGGRSEW